MLNRSTFSHCHVLHCWSSRALRNFQWLQFGLVNPDQAGVLTSEEMQTVKLYCWTALTSTLARAYLKSSVSFTRVCCLPNKGNEI